MGSPWNGCPIFYLMRLQDILKCQTSSPLHFHLELSSVYLTGIWFLWILIATCVTQITVAPKTGCWLLFEPFNVNRWWIKMKMDGNCAQTEAAFSCQDWIKGSWPPELLSYSSDNSHIVASLNIDCVLLWEKVQRPTFQFQRNVKWSSRDETRGADEKWRLSGPGNYEWCKKWFLRVIKQTEVKRNVWRHNWKVGWVNGYLQVWWAPNLMI